MTAPQSFPDPGRLELLAGFVNTLDYAAGPDALATPASASQWCRDHGLAPISNHREVERLRAFREVLRDVLLANNGEAGVEGAWQAMNPYLAAGSYRVAAGGGGRLTLQPGGAGAERTIASMLAIVYDAMAAGTWRRLRACRHSTCRFAYYDSSKNGSRAWCSMAVCGNREKAARRRTRERDERQR
ncbi:MAG TPA: CGNR zinc finger domain-containing protein [Candidatus Tumulicola sp.]